ncbi:hypothetical protein [Nitrosopumilus sp.]|uniref:hypothetical protein n=1 Tax=Nitrosopumilus sp. TaxID=2024843 RepID=UPI00247E6492|nr:hypothetical protein [Nitrosopumilus sp.]MCV0410100.1 hypothetical protein [Nitrosopumilus sp.]
MSQKQEPIVQYECECESEKRFRITFDGGDTGDYSVEYCQSCFDKDDKQFMISMEECHG